MQTLPLTVITHQYPHTVKLPRLCFVSMTLTLARQLCDWLDTNVCMSCVFAASPNSFLESSVFTAKA